MALDEAAAVSYVVAGLPQRRGQGVLVKENSLAILEMVVFVVVPQEMVCGV